jgi:hypothetical protein
VSFWWLNDNKVKGLTIFLCIEYVYNYILYTWFMWIVISVEVYHWVKYKIKPNVLYIALKWKSKMRCCCRNNLVQTKDNNKNETKKITYILGQVWFKWKQAWLCWFHKTRGVAYDGLTLKTCYGIHSWWEYFDRMKLNVCFIFERELGLHLVPK